MDVQNLKTYYLSKSTLIIPPRVLLQSRTTTCPFWTVEMTYQKLDFLPTSFSKGVCTRINLWMFSISVPRRWTL